jgi:hypothetical protein
MVAKLESFGTLERTIDIQVRWLSRTIRIEATGTTPNPGTHLTLRVDRTIHHNPKQPGAEKRFATEAFDSPEQQAE